LFRSTFSGSGDSQDPDFDSPISITDHDDDLLKRLMSLGYLRRLTDNSIELSIWKLVVLEGNHNGSYFTSQKRFTGRCRRVDDWPTNRSRSRSATRRREEAAAAAAAAAGTTTGTTTQTGVRTGNPRQDVLNVLDELQSAIAEVENTEYGEVVDNAIREDLLGVRELLQENNFMVDYDRLEDAIEEMGQEW